MTHNVNMLRKSLERFKGDEQVTIEIQGKFLFIMVNQIPVNSFLGWKE